MERGKVADYIPQLANVNPDLYGICFCDVAGKIYARGDSENAFCLQSCSKPLSYCLARTLRDDVHSHVGYEPSGHAFNSFMLNRDGMPHNPMINAGAIMVASLLNPGEEPSERFDTVRKFYQRLSGNIGHIGFENTTFLSEKRHADRNISLAYYMRENNAFDGYPTPSELNDTLDLYFQCCSVTVTCRVLASMGATLANAGVCPITNEVVLSREIVRDALSLLFACGMYDFSGQFAFEVGLPAKSGVSGCLILVVPGLGGISIWSPRLDAMGNTVRGVEFCKRFVAKTRHRYHIFDTSRAESAGRYNVCDGEGDDDAVQTQRLITAAARGDLECVRVFGRAQLNVGDYDGRTALHLASAEGHVPVVRYLLQNGCTYDVKDRWGNTPYHEANKLRGEGGAHRQIAEMFEAAAAGEGGEPTS